MGWLKKIHTYIKYQKKSFLYLGKDVDYQHLTTKYIQPEKISIDDFSKIGEDSYLDGSGGIYIGKCTIIGPKITIITANHKYESKSFLPYDNVMIRKKVTIEDYCWIGRNVMIMPGVHIGKASIIAAGSVVVNDINAYTIAGGNPAQIIKQRDKKIVDTLIKENKCVSNCSMNKNMTKVWQ